jgi:hypothetical protein
MDHLLQDYADSLGNLFRDILPLHDADDVGPIRASYIRNLQGIPPP